MAAGEGSTAHLSTIGVTPGAKHDGSIKPLLESQINVELTSIALNSNQVRFLSLEFKDLKCRFELCELHYGKLFLKLY